MGVFVTRSPFRPNSLGLTLVKLEGVESGVLTVSGADLVCGTPIYDIKPYLPDFESIPCATGGFADSFTGYKLEVEFPKELYEIIPSQKAEALIEILKGDPRPSYQNDPKRIYGFAYAGYEVKFRVDGTTLIVSDVKEK